MTPSARLQASAEILDHIRSHKKPAEMVLKDWGRSHRYAGSKDRRAIADCVYQCLRARERLSFLMKSEEGRALVLGALRLQNGLELHEIDALFNGEGYGPSPLSDEERRYLSADNEEAPAWLEAGLPEFVVDDLKLRSDWLEEAQALMMPRAPIDLRVTGDRDSLLQGLVMLGYRAEMTPLSAFGIRLAAEPPPNIRSIPAFAQGLIEIQDEGSQLAAYLAGAKPGMTVIDYCSGGGGKSLALLQIMQGQGRIVCCDVDLKRLNNIKPRLNRAGQVAEFVHLNEASEGLEAFEAKADLVLVDAPCSGSGVWRRRPETAHKLTKAEVERLHELQVSILDRASRLVKPGGLLAYATCSILSSENEQTCARFEAMHPEFSPRPVAQAVVNQAITEHGQAKLSALAHGHQLRLSPHSANTDGFFIALYSKGQSHD